MRNEQLSSPRSLRWTYHLGTTLTPLLPDEYGDVILMSSSYFVYDPEAPYVSVMPTSVPNIPDQITYVEYDDPEIAHAMNPASENFVDPIFRFNTGLVAIESTTWGSV